MPSVCCVDMVCMSEEDRKLQIAMSAHMKQLIGQCSAVVLLYPVSLELVSAIKHICKLSWKTSPAAM